MTSEFKRNAGKHAANQLLADIEELAPYIQSRSAEMEASGRIPIDLIESLRAIGLFRLFVPRSHGGFELDLIDGIEIFQALARIDGSVGWSAMISNGASVLTTLLPPETYDRIYEKGPDVIFAGSLRPNGKAEATDNAWRLNGRWDFASGCQHADWMFGTFVMSKDGVQLTRPNGQKVTRGCLVAAQDWKIKETWHVAGLKATGSHDIEITDVVVPEAHFFDAFDPQFRKPGPFYQEPLPLLLLTVPAIFVGVAAGALDEILRVANSGRQQFMAAAPMRDSELFQAELGRIEADLNAARAYLQVQVASHWSHALNGTLEKEPFLTQTAQTSAWLGATCVRIANDCFALGGSNAVYESSLLQRRLRDLLTASQHMIAQRRQYVSSGKLLLEPTWHTPRDFSAVPAKPA
ncbi:MAG: acyl-CoA dehydrogenase family protein [Verrucomicrobia bacterium]|nr:acyl-CoA dehydrogenase family protein [Verrucomicrobiota bacterium]